MLNAPNLLSGYRIFIFPLIIFFIYTGRVELYLLFLCINLLTDILDGAIARLCKSQTSFGARLDSLGDICTYVIAGYGIFHFKWHEIGNATMWAWIFLLVFLWTFLISFIRFNKYPSLHLYSCKIGGVLDGVLFLYLFLIGYNQWLFMLAMVWGTLSFIEEIVVLLVLKELRSDCKGLYWVLKSMSHPLS